eukprot:scaffold2903_cov77-Isochrysis_galbana.AAC.4
MTLHDRARPNAFPTTACTLIRRATPPRPCRGCPAPPHHPLPRRAASLAHRPPRSLGGELQRTRWPTVGADRRGGGSRDTLPLGWRRPDATRDRRLPFPRRSRVRRRRRTCSRRPLR